jgi:hypothetical protein
VSFPAIRNLKPARTLALDDDFAVPLAQFDLANVSAGRRQPSSATRVARFRQVCARHWVVGGFEMEAAQPE